MANVGFYDNSLKNLLTDPSSFQQTPGFKFAMDQGLQAVGRSNSRMRGSGNALAELTKYGTGLANQEYGNQVDRMGRLLGQEQQYGLGEESNRLTGIRDQNNYSLGSQQNANTLRLGLGQNANTAQNNKWQYQLGLGQNANTRRGNDQQFGLGMQNSNNAFTLGNQQNQNTSQNNAWNYQLGNQQNNNQAANNQNNFNLNWATNQGNNALGWYNAQTNRGSAQSQDWWRDPRNSQSSDQFGNYW